MKTQRSLASISVPRPTLPFPVFPGGASLRSLQSPSGLISRLWNWFKARQQSHSSTRRLQVAATASLGEKRFVALIKIDELEFLVGGGPANLVLLAQVNAKQQFGDMLKGNMSAPVRPAKRANKPMARPTPKTTPKPAAKLMPKTLIRPAAKLTLKPVVKAATKKPVKPVAAQTGRQAARQTRKQA
jgi:flagellar biogenesis protein FliO